MACSVLHMTSSSRFSSAAEILCTVTAEDDYCYSLTFSALFFVVFGSPTVTRTPPSSASGFSLTSCMCSISLYRSYIWVMAFLSDSFSYFKSLLRVRVGCPVAPELLLAFDFFLLPRVCERFTDLADYLTSSSESDDSRNSPSISSWFLRRPRRRLLSTDVLLLLLSLSLTEKACCKLVKLR